MGDRLRRSLVLVGMTASLVACSTVSKEPVLAIDERIQLNRGEQRAFPIEIDHPGKLKVEVNNLEGERLYVYLINRSEMPALENKREWRYLTIFSHPDLEERFDSGWRRIAGPGIYSLIVRPHDKDLSTSGATPQATSVVRVRALLQ